MSTLVKLLVLTVTAVAVAVGAYLVLNRQAAPAAANAMATNGATANASEVLHLTDAHDHKAEVEDSKIPVLLDFHATWCPPCQMLSPHIEAVAKQFKGKVKVVKVDVDQNPALKRKYGVRAMPTLVIVLPNGKGQVKSVGYQDLPSLKKWIEDNTK